MVCNGLERDCLPRVGGVTVRFEVWFEPGERKRSLGICFLMWRQWVSK